MIFADFFKSGISSKQDFMLNSHLVLKLHPTGLLITEIGLPLIEYSFLVFSLIRGIELINPHVYGWAGL